MSPVYSASPPDLSNKKVRQLDIFLEHNHNVKRIYRKINASCR